MFPFYFEFAFRRIKHLLRSSELENFLVLTVEFMALNCSCSRFICCVKVDLFFLIKHVFCGRSQTDLSSLGLDSLLLLAVSLAVCKKEAE